MLAAVLLGMAILFSSCGTVAFVFFFDKPDIARWDTAQTSMNEITKALNDYSLQHKGAYPPDLSLLSPMYFRNGTPRDPFTKEDFKYELTPTGFRLTCLGKDQRPGGAEKPDRDIAFDESGLR